jgi:hypothetical protein
LGREGGVERDKLYQLGFPLKKGSCRRLRGFTVFIDNNKNFVPKSMFSGLIYILKIQEEFYEEKEYLYYIAGSIGYDVSLQ